MTEITRRTLEEGFVKFDVINTISCKVEDKLLCTLQGIYDGKPIGIDLGPIDGMDGDIDMVSGGVSRHIWIKAGPEAKAVRISHDKQLGHILNIRRIRISYVL